MRVNIGDIPVWQGVQNKPGFTAIPFSFEVRDRLIRQAVSSDVLEGITQAYNLDSYSYITSPPGISEWGTLLGDWYFDTLAARVGDLTGKHVLEIGSGSLYIAERVASELNAGSLVACDPSLRQESEMETIEVIRDYFSWDLLQDQVFDVILSINSLEHINDPAQYLSDARRLLETRNGSIYVVVPDCSRGLRTGDLGIAVHEHLSYFTPDTLIGLFGDCGLSVDWLHTQDDTIFVTARPDAPGLNSLPASDSPDAMLQTFDSKYRENLAVARDLIQTLKQERLAIHGCSAGLNNLLALLEINGDDNIFLFDADVEKVGQYLPTFNKPIYSASDTLYESMDAVIVAALTYHDEIAAQLESEHKIPRNRIHPIFPL